MELFLFKTIKVVFMFLLLAVRSIFIYDSASLFMYVLYMYYFFEEHINLSQKNMTCSLLTLTAMLPYHWYNTNKMNGMVFFPQIWCPRHRQCWWIDTVPYCSFSISYLSWTSSWTPLLRCCGLKMSSFWCFMCE